MEPFLGTIMLFGFNFVPRGWAACNGQLLAISQHSALFALLGTQYGGNGQTTFALPDLRGRVPLGQGQGPGLPNFVTGQLGGVPSVSLTTSELPPHSHAVNAAGSATSKVPMNNLPAVSAAGSAYGPTAAGTMAAGMVQPTGQGVPHENMQPYLVANWCIAIEGIFPSRD